MGSSKQVVAGGSMQAAAGGMGKGLHMLAGAAAAQSRTQAEMLRRAAQGSQTWQERLLVQ